MPLKTDGAVTRKETPPSEEPEGGVKRPLSSNTENVCTNNEDSAKNTFRPEKAFSKSVNINLPMSNFRLPNPKNVNFYGRMNF
jgi:hypothetical protein